MRAVFMLYALKKMRETEALALLLPLVTPPVSAEVDLDGNDIKRKTKQKSQTQLPSTIKPKESCADSWKNTSFCFPSVPPLIQ